MPAIPALGKLEQDTCEFQADLGYKVRPALKIRLVGRGCRNGPEVKSTVCASKGLGSIPNTHMTSAGTRHASDTHTDIQAKHLCIKNKSKKIIKREERAGKMTQWIK